ncbi:hypothetical protein [Ekhidna sp.]
MKYLNIRQLAFVFILFLLACQEDELIENQPIDEDLIAASQLADEYFNIKGRTGSTERAITVLKYVDGNIYFNTNTDDVDGYQIVTETTVTAYVEPGEFVFWYRGGGLDDLEDVDFDENAEAYLNQLPEEFKEDQMFVLQVPETYDPNNDELKYDIVYESKENKGVVVRLDPKIGVVDNGNAHDDDSDSGDSGESGGTND